MPYTTSLPESAGHGNFDPAYAGMVDSATDQKMTIQLFPPGKPSPESPPQQVSLQRPVGHSGANPLQSYLQTSQGSCMTLQPTNNSVARHARSGKWRPRIPHSCNSFISSTFVHLHRFTTTLSPVPSRDITDATQAMDAMRHNSSSVRGRPGWVPRGGNTVGLRPYKPTPTASFAGKGRCRRGEGGSRTD